jgi:hypothetical protein
VQRAFAGVLGIGEEQRPVIAVHQQTRHKMGFRVVIDVMHTCDTGDESLYHIMRPGHPPQ